MRKLFLLLITFSLLLFSCLFISMVGESSIDLPFRTTLNAIAFSPQGWAFFTLDARLERTLIYRPSDREHPIAARILAESLRRSIEEIGSEI